MLNGGGEMTVEYRDEHGNTLKGFSQIDLDKLNRNIKWVISILTIGLIFFIMIIIWILWQLKRYKIVTHLIQSLR